LAKDIKYKILFLFLLTYILAHYDTLAE